MKENVCSTCGKEFSKKANLIIFLNRNSFWQKLHMKPTLENSQLQGWGCLEQAIMTSQRQISEDLLYQELSNIELVHTLF